LDEKHKLGYWYNKITNQKIIINAYNIKDYKVTEKDFEGYLYIGEHVNFDKDGVGQIFFSNGN